MEKEVRASALWPEVWAGSAQLAGAPGEGAASRTSRETLGGRREKAEG